MEQKIRNQSKSWQDLKSGHFLREGLKKKKINGKFDYGGLGQHGKIYHYLFFKNELKTLKIALKSL